jgi:hypothetical protein
MRKQLWAVAALILLALQPARAQSKSPTITTFNFNILQAQPCNPNRADLVGFVPLPSGILNTDFCVVGGATAMAAIGTKPACRFVGSVLCLDAGPNGDFASFTGGGPAGTTPVVQGVKLIKTVPLVAKCPDTFPGATFIQTGNTGIRTFFPLKFTPCDTVFTLEIEFACVTPPDRAIPVDVRVNRFNFKVVVRPDTLEWVVDALHCEPLGVCEVPCISDEGLFQTLLTQARAIATAASNAASDQTKVPALNTALDTFEATVVKNCTFQQQVFQVDDKGNLLPCAIFAGTLPSNNTIADFGFGIVDTLENPCCCKLITDVFCLKGQLIGKP